MCFKVEMGLFSTFLVLLNTILYNESAQEDKVVLEEDDISSSAGEL